MKLTSKFAVAAGLAAVSLGIIGSQAWAWPTGPSAKAAARLKYNPPKNWIQHYLPDDRYKIAGNIWKVVSTDLDVYYHRPDCPNALRQQAGQIIGFPTHTEAEEAGYRPDGTCSPNLPFNVVVQHARAKRAGKSLALLADGESSILVPQGWRHVFLGADKHGQGMVALDGIVKEDKKKGSKDFIFILSVIGAPGENHNKLFSLDAWTKETTTAKRVINLQEKSGVVNTGLSKFVDTYGKFYKTATTKPVVVSGIPSLKINMDWEEKGRFVDVYVVPKGRLAWVFVPYAPNTPIGQIVASAKLK